MNISHNELNDHNNMGNNLNYFNNHNKMNYNAMNSNNNSIPLNENKMKTMNI